MSSPSDDQERYVPLETPPLDAVVDYWEPEKGPDGYHADFTRIAGLPETADSWVVLAAGESYGPFGTEDEALRWAIASEVPPVWYVVPLRKPGEWPGAGLEEPQEADLPLFDALKEAP